MKRLDEKLARIRAGQYRRQDFIIADAKDPDMGPSLTWSGPKREPDGSWTRYRTPRGVPRPDPRHRPPGHRRHHADVGLQHGAAERRGPVRGQRGQAGDPRQRHHRHLADARRHLPRAAVAPVPLGLDPAHHVRHRDADAGCRDHRHRPRPLLDHLQPRPRRRPGLAGGLRRLPRRGRRVRLQVLPRGVQPERRDRHRSRDPAPLHQRQHPALPRRRALRPTGRSSSRSSTTAPRRWRS